MTGIQAGGEPTYPANTTLETPGQAYCSGDFRRLLIRMAKAQKGDLRSLAARQRLDGWLDLIAHLEKRPCTDQRVQQALAAWQRAHPKHPAADLFPQLSRRSHTKAAVRPGLLLPLSGHFGEFSRQIANAARQAGRTSAIPLRLYDTEKAGLQAAYAQALADDIGCLIGPLQKRQVRRLAAMPPRLPTLTLNSLVDARHAPPRFYHLAPPPRGEALAAAELLARLGHDSGLLLWLRGRDRAERLASAFRLAWDAHDGYLTDQVAIDPDATDFSDTLTTILGLAESQARHRGLETTLNSQLHFTPRRRRDIDFILILTDPSLGRMLYPQLRFWHADDLPIYAVADIIGGPQHGDLADLEGLRVIVPPWSRETGNGNPSDPATLADYLGRSAIAIAIAIADTTQCLGSPQRAAYQGSASAWRFDPVSGTFLGHSQLAVVRRGRLRVREM